MNNQSNSYLLPATNLTHRLFQYYTCPTQKETIAAISAIQPYLSLYFPKNRTIIDHTYLICMEV